MSPHYKRLVVAYDGSPLAELALDTAIDLARDWSSHLSVVMVYQPPVVLAFGPVPPDYPGEEVERALREALSRAMDHVKERGLSDARGEFLQGHPAEEILRYAEAEHADLLVMGSRGLSSARRLLLGSVSDAVVHHTHAAVLVVRPLGLA